MPLLPSEKRALAVASLRAQGLPQEEVAGILGIKSQTTVSRAEKEAREAGWLSTQVVFSWPENISPDEKQETEAWTFPQREELHFKLIRLAEERDGVAPTTINVIHAAAQSEAAEFGRLASQRIAQLIDLSYLCAVAWGQTISGVVKGISTEQSHEHSEKVFLPISGEPLNHRAEGFSPSRLAGDLSEAFGTTRRLSLNGVPARIPKDMAGDMKVIRSYVDHCYDYKEIFGPQDDPESSLMSKVDMVLSGIGDPQSSNNDPWYLEIQDMEGGAQLSDIAVGNIGGVWLPPDDATSKKRKAVEAINERWLGIKEHHIQHCADISAQRSTPGVVIVARERAKVRVMLRTVGMVNHYVISKDLVDAAISTLKD